MIHATGLVTFLSYTLNTNNKIYKQSKNVHMEITDYQNVIDIDNQSAIKVTCKYSILIPEKYQCKSLEDYTGQVFPALKVHINRIVRTEVYNITYVPPSINHIRKAMKY